MKHLIVALTTLLATPALADDVQGMKPALTALTAPAVIDATVAERTTSARVEYFAKLTTIAEYDLATAQLQLDLYSAQWTKAIRVGDSKAAGDYATKYQQAMHDQRDAMGREMLYRAERDLARAEFQAAAKGLKRTMAKAQRTRT